MTWETGVVDLGQNAAKAAQIALVPSICSFPRGNSILAIGRVTRLGGHHVKMTFQAVHDENFILVLC